jgi:hypothetical protein
MEHLEHKMFLVGGVVMTIKVIDKHDFDILILILSVIFEIIFFMTFYGF